MKKPFKILLGAAGAAGLAVGAFCGAAALTHAFVMDNRKKAADSIQKQQSVYSCGDG